MFEGDECCPDELHPNQSPNLLRVQPKPSPSYKSNLPLQPTVHTGTILVFEFYNQFASVNLKVIHSQLFLYECGKNLSHQNVTRIVCWKHFNPLETLKTRVV